MVEFNGILKEFTVMKSKAELEVEMTVLPEYDAAIRNESATVRLMALSNIYKVYVPSAMSYEIYSKLYLSLLSSLQKKETKLAVLQRNKNHEGMKIHEYSGILGGNDSYTIIGHSGIGKSSAISRAIMLITENKIIKLSKPSTMIIPCLIVQVPFDCSVKSMLLEILRSVDAVIGMDYYPKAVKIRATTDLLIGMVSTVALNHIGLLICDEIQNVVNNKNGKGLIGALTQLINNSGISICMVGTPESKRFFEQAFQLARRSQGLNYSAMEFNDDFVKICKTLFSYQFVKKTSGITDGVIEWLYEHSGGVISIVVNLLHDAQELAILSGSEALDLDMLNYAYKNRLQLLHEYIEPTIVHKKQTTAQKKKNSKKSIENNRTDAESTNGVAIVDLVSKAKAENVDIVALIRQHCAVDEVVV